MINVKDGLTYISGTFEEAYRDMIAVMAGYLNFLESSGIKEERANAILAGTMFKAVALKREGKILSHTATVKAKGTGTEMKFDLGKKDEEEEET